MAGKCSGFLASLMIGRIPECSSQSSKKFESICQSDSQSPNIRGWWFPVSVTWFSKLTTRYNFSRPCHQLQSRLTLLVLVTGLFPRPGDKLELFFLLWPGLFSSRFVPVICFVWSSDWRRSRRLCYCFGFVFTKCNRSLLFRDSLNRM